MEYSENWNGLALGYISDIVCIVHDFITSLLSALCPDAKVERGLKHVLSEHLLARYRSGIDQAAFILRVERGATPLTMNHYFVDMIEKGYVCINQNTFVKTHPGLGVRIDSKA